MSHILVLCAVRYFNIQTCHKHDLGLRSSGSRGSILCMTLGGVERRRREKEERKWDWWREWERERTRGRDCEMEKREREMERDREKK